MPPTNLDDLDLIQSAEAATIFGWSQATLNRKVAAGIIPSVTKLDGRTGPRLFDRAVIERIANERQEVAS